METYQVPDLVKPSDEIIALGHEVYPSLSHALQKLKEVVLPDFVN